MGLSQLPDSQNSENGTHDYYGDIILLFSGKETELKNGGYITHKEADAKLNTIWQSLTNSEICFFNQRPMNMEDRLNIYSRITDYICKICKLVNEKMAILHTEYNISYSLLGSSNNIYSPELYTIKSFERLDVSIPLMKFLLWSYYCMLLDYGNTPQQDIRKLYRNYHKGRVATMDIYKIIDDILMLEKEYHNENLIYQIQANYDFRVYSEKLGKEIVAILQ